MEHRLSFTRDELPTFDEVAEILCVRGTTALDYMRRGVIPARKIGRLWVLAEITARRAPDLPLRGRE